ncbi:4Fe-4S dicluster domain-containing protein [Shewanella sp. M16]|uniref:4Fe-4S dicluster domain-containing protein n=1 Tax=Shewanella TaxID=22 RepID=UPI001BB069CB|nr:4Fe-4S dicluster domain-containing protein [Shewanella sp. M16]MBS0044471.1 4Fe-4S dicluster domain-containing protein [Shewanella sp. M16]
MTHNTQAPTVNVDVKLSTNKFYVDEGHPHIILKNNPDINEYKKLVNACPAGLYKLESDGSIKFDSAGCLECGTCKFLCADSIIDKWEYPRGTFGVEYRYG